MSKAEHIKEGYKNSPLGMIPAEWEIKNLGEVVKVLVGKDLREDQYSPNQDEEHKYPVYSNTVENFGLYGYYNTEEYSGESLTVVGRGVGLGTTFTRTGSYGAIGRLLVLFPKKNIAAHYLTELINSRVKVYTESSGIPQLTGEQIAKYKVVVPPLPEQIAIANLLTAWDKAIQTSNAIIAQKELRKKWLMQQLLTGKKRLKGFSWEWEEYKLKEIFDRVTRKNEEGNNNVVTISAQRGFVRQGEFFNKIVASDILDNYFLVHKGEFCYNKSYSNGYPWGATKRLNDYDKAVVTTLYICFGIRNEEKSYPDFFEQYFEANLLDKGLMKIAHEGGRAHGLLNVTPSDFFDLKITIPATKEQIAIATVLLAADKELQLQKAKADQLKEQKKGLMQVLLTGKKRIKINI